MKAQPYAVLTGDLINSTTIQTDYRQVLQQIAEDVQHHIDPNMLFEIFRGDSFQLLLTQPREALRVALLFRVGMRRYSNTVRLSSAWDARVSIGIGDVEEVNRPKPIKLGLLDGDAFIRSGRALDSMKAEGASLRITTGDESMNKSLLVATSLSDAIISRWSTPQSNALYLYLLRELTQKEIGEHLNVSQRAIGQRLDSAQFHHFQPFLKYFQETF